MYFIFGDYTLDTQRYEFRRAGMLVKLERRVFNALAFLLQHRDQVVTRRELFAHLWPHLFVSASALEQCIAAARRAVGDSGQEQRVIQTLYGRGYRFVATVEECPLALPHVTLPIRPLTSQVTNAWRPTDAVSSTSSAFPCPTDSSPLLDEDRKPITVLCGGLVTPSALTERLGQAVSQRLVYAFIALAQDVMGRYEGTMQLFEEAGFLVLFGVPVAQEDHAWRAMLAAAELQRRLGTFQADWGIELEAALGMRLGIHTGLMMTGHDCHEPQGPARVAAHLQSRAEPGVLLISAATLRLVRGRVESEISGLIHVTSQADPVMTYKVLAMAPWPMTVGQGEERGRRPFVGRERDLAVMDALLTSAAHGQGQVVGIVGEPGMGKSRLLAEFCRRLSGQDVAYLEGHCLSYGDLMPYRPILEILRQLCGITETERPETTAAKVSQTLREGGMAPEVNAPYLLQLLGMPDDTARTVRLSLTPQVWQERTFAVLRDLCRHCSRQRPLIIAVEDLHWIDPASEAYLLSWVEHLAGTPLLLLLTYRPGYHPPWMEKSYATQIALQRLGARDSLEVVRAVLSPEPFPASLTEVILERAEGNPLFLEELAHAVLEQGSTSGEVTVPETIQGVLMARMDRLPYACKRVLQTAAVCGRVVSRRLLRALWVGPDELEPSLRELQRLELLYESGGSEEPVYVFKHVLMWEVAYQSLLPARRQALHAALGEPWKSCEATT